MLTAEIIAVGSELLTPTKTDSNGLWITEKLNDIGVEVMLKTIVGDDEERLEETIRDAVKRSDIVVTTGGLGPTEDDLTRRAAARAVGRSLVYHSELEDELRERFRRWGREMPEINKRQAYVIDGAEILPNPNGSAAGMMLTIDGSSTIRLVVLPGPPREMRPMFEDFVLQRLRETSGTTVVTRRILRVTGMGESALDEAIAPIYTSVKDLRTSILFNRSEVEIHLAVESDSRESGEAVIAGVVSQIDAKLGPAVFAHNGESMEEIVGSLLIERKATLSVAESCTGGLIAMRLTDIAGSSAFFTEGAVTYSNEAKVRNLGIDQATLDKNGAVSAEIAEEMAAGMLRRAGTEYAIAVTGIAGPGGGSDEKPVGTVFIGLAGRSGVRSLKLMLPGDRYLIRWRSSQAALDLLRRRLMRT